MFRGVPYPQVGLEHVGKPYVLDIPLDATPLKPLLWHQFVNLGMNLALAVLPRALHPAVDQTVGKRGIEESAGELAGIWNRGLGGRCSSSAYARAPTLLAPPSER